MAIQDPLQQSFDGFPSTSGVLELARRAQSGDQDALTRLFQHYQEELRRIVRIRMGAQLRVAGGLESLDVVQQTFMKAWTKLDDFQITSERGVLGWLARIAERQILDELDKTRAEKRALRRTVSIEDILGLNLSSSSLAFEPAASDTLPEGHAMRAELRRIVDEAVQELDDAQREVILLRNYADADWDEVQRQTGAPTVKAAQATHFRARARLATILARRLPSDLLGEA